MRAALTITAVTAAASTSATTARPVTGRGGAGVGDGWSSSLTRLGGLIRRRLLDRPDRHRGRVAAEGRPEVGRGQGIERLVVDQRLDALVQSVLVGRALGVDRAVLLARLVLPDDLELIAGLLGLGEHDRGVEEVRVDLPGQQALVERGRVGGGLGGRAVEIVLQEVDRRGAGVRRTGLRRDVVLGDVCSLLHQHPDVGVEVRRGEVHDLLPLVGDRDLRESEVEVVGAAGDQLVEGHVLDHELAEPGHVGQLGGHAVLVAVLDRLGRRAVPPSGSGQRRLHRQRVGRGRRQLDGVRLARDLAVAVGPCGRGTSGVRRCRGRVRTSARREGRGDGDDAHQSDGALEEHAWVSFRRESLRWAWVAESSSTPPESRTLRSDSVPIRQPRYRKLQRYGGDMSDIASLTREEAAQRAALISVQRYDVHVDLRGLFEGDLWAATSTISFTCREPGAGTFVDCVGKVSSVTLNGQALDPMTAEHGRIPLTDLQPDNVLVVSHSQSDTGSGTAILKTVDPNDKLVYVWSTFEPDMARYAFACFDQPDLKAPHGFVVDAPEAWTVTSNSAPDSVDDLDEGGRRWTFADTPPLSTYVTVVNAGPFHEVRSTRGGYDLGLFCRQSLAQFLERDAEELFDLTDRGLAFFGERFGQPFPQERYDQVFVPNMGGAMENWGSVTWTDSVIYRSQPTFGQRAVRAQILLHEMAHMWFGDLVTMRWWDDLWLNEAFASWASNWAGVNATEFTDEWATFLAGEKMGGYRQDMSPATHPIRGDVPNVAQAMANFDAITYTKGASVLKQLMAFVGEDAFVEGLRRYFHDHAWGNTRLDDLMSAVGGAAGRDLSDWTVSWLDRAGTDTLRLEGGTISAASPDDDAPRPHRLHVGSHPPFARGLAPVATTPVETSGTATEVDLPPADLHLLNAGDQTFAAVRPDPDSVRVLLDRAADLPTAVDRALAVVTGFQMLSEGDLGADDLFACVLDLLRREKSPAVVEPFLNTALEIAQRWSAPERIPEHLARLADVAAALADDPDLVLPALRTLAASASTDEHLARLDHASTDDVDLAWRVATRRAALGRYDEEAIEALLERDPDPDAGIRALAVRTARPESGAKDEAWNELFEKRNIPGGPMLGAMVRAFWQPQQGEVLLPYADRFLDEIPALAGGGMLAVFGLMFGMFPQVADEAFVARAQGIAAEPDCDPTVRAALLIGTDTLARMERSRAA